MWLLSTHRAELHYFPSPELVPGGYAIFSHTWGDNEQTFQETQALYQQCKKSSKNPRELSSEKVRESCILAEHHGYRWIWNDTCCIDKTSSTELSEAINSMFRWYSLAEVCFAYIEGVDNPDPGQRVQVLEAPKSAFRKARWHTRGWTLQELIAPSLLIFVSGDWKIIGNKVELALLLEEITGVPSQVLTREVHYSVPSIAERMSWASTRSTMRVEDEAYCLMGLFNVYMPTIYGEGDGAFQRLQYEIAKQSSDTSLFAWGSCTHSPKVSRNNTPKVTPERTTCVKTASVHTTHFPAGRIASTHRTRSESAKTALTPTTSPTAAFTPTPSPKTTLTRNRSSEFAITPTPSPKAVSLRTQRSLKVAIAPTPSPKIGSMHTRSPEVASSMPPRSRKADSIQTHSLKASAMRTTPPKTAFAPTTPHKTAFVHTCSPVGKGASMHTGSESHKSAFTTPPKSAFVLATPPKTPSLHGRSSGSKTSSITLDSESQDVSGLLNTSSQNHMCLLADSPRRFFRPQGKTVRYTPDIWGSRDLSSSQPYIDWWTKKTSSVCHFYGVREQAQLTGCSRIKPNPD